MFAIFMAANLATGAVNISMRTLEADTWTAVIVISVYTTSIFGLAMALAKCNLVLKG